jgi:hypothetical protein
MKTLSFRDSRPWPIRGGPQAKFGTRHRAIRLKTPPRPWALAVFMAMVDVRVVRMPVPKRFMPVPVRMRLRHRSFVSVVMMVVVDMGMLVLDWLVRVFMGMPFGQMQPDAERHQQARDDQLRRDRLA